MTGLYIIYIIINYKMDKRPGDWTCSNCMDINFAKNIVCRVCKIEKGTYFGEPGDWTCKCGEINFKSRTECRKCRVGKFDTVKIEKSGVFLDHDIKEHIQEKTYVQEPGDWKCKCGEMNFKSRSVCRRCESGKFDGTKIVKSVEPVVKRYIQEPGDWKCDCGEMNFKSRSVCRKCKSYKTNE